MNKYRKATTAGVTLTLLAAALTGCAGSAKTTATTEPAAPAATTATAAPARGLLTGKVVETMDAGGYTYVNLENEGTRRWVAAPVMKVDVGQELKLLPGAEMTNFSSKALNRTFDSIIFSAGQDQSAAAKPGKPAPAPAPATYDDPNESATPILAGKVIETMDAMNYTYIKLEKDGKNAWAAVPYAPVKVGDDIELQPGTEMGKFTSKKLNKTFNSIYFAAGIKKNHSAPQPEAGAKTNPAAAPLPAGHPSIDAAAQQAPMAPVPVPADKLVTGTVVETAEAGGYTYICLDKEGKRTWAAVPSTKVREGQDLALLPGVTMHNFVSKSLNRTFDKILFSGGIQY